MTTDREYQLIPLTEIHESKHNPRRHFDGPALEQLADSIRKVGVLTPALVRPNGKGFELAAGHRRYRAAKMAGIDALPCRVRPLTDQQFMEVLTIENLQREDVHPLDEAKGYEALMAAPYKMDVQKIADRVGRSVKYIYDRVKLLALCKEGQQLFWDGLIEAGHAILLARLTPAEQAKVIGSKKENYIDGGLLHPEERLFESDEEEQQAWISGGPVKACSVRELESYIKQHIRFNAKQADAFLFPETVQQVDQATQDKRKIIEITHEYLANDDVRQAGDGRIYGERAWKRADGKEGSKTCDRSVLGVVASGRGQGHAFLVCINKDKCLVHWKEHAKAKADRQKAKAAGPDAVQKQRQKEAEENNTRQREAEQRGRVRRAIFEQLAAKIKGPLKAADLLMLAIDHVEQATNDLLDHDYIDLLGFKDTYPSREIVSAVAAKQKDLTAWMFLATVLCLPNCWRGDGDKTLRKVAERFKIDVKAIEQREAERIDVLEANERGNKQGKAIEKRRAKKKAAVQTSAKGKKKAA